MTPDNDNSLWPYLWDVIKWVFGGIGVIALGAWRSAKRKNNVRFRHIEERVEEIDKRIITQPIEYVSRETFQRHERDTKDAIDQLRVEGNHREQRIIASVENQANRIHARIDELFRNGSKR